MKRIAGAFVGSAALVVMLASPAHAVSEEGFKNCGGTGSTVTTRGYATQYQSHYHGSAVHHFGSSGYAYVARLKNFGITSTGWTVYSSGNLDPTGTYAYCPG